MLISAGGAAGRISLTRTVGTCSPVAQKVTKPRRPTWNPLHLSSCPLSSATLLIKRDLSIESLSSQRGFFHDLDPDDNWVKLWFTFWGKEGGWDTTQQVIRGFDPIDDFLLPHVVPAECDVMIKPGVVDNCWHLESESIFIRSEYKEAEEFAVSACGAARRNMALMVTGQPGIGSSLSILPSPTQVLSSFIRKIYLSPPFALAPSCIQTSYRTASRLRSCHAFLQRWCEGIFTAQERPSLQLAPT